MRDKGTASREYLSITWGQCANGGNISNNIGKSIKSQGYQREKERGRCQKWGNWEQGNIINGQNDKGIQGV